MKKKVQSRPTQLDMKKIIKKKNFFIQLLKTEKN
jgi:hypothetical protein